MEGGRGGEGGDDFYAYRWKVADFNPPGAKEPSNGSSFKKKVNTGFQKSSVRRIFCQ